MFHNQDSGAFTSPAANVTQNTLQYLPEYLLGEPTVSTSPGQSNHARNLSVLTNSPWANLSASSGQHLPQTPTSRYVRNSVIEKQGGPPIFGLYDQQNSTSTNSTFSNNIPHAQSNQDAYMASPPKSRDISFKANKSLLMQNNSITSPAQLDPFYTQGENLNPDEDLDQTWVTVFGFPPSAVSYILQQFSQYGNILQHKITGGNNWIHLHFQSKIQAKKALGKNGKIICGNMMIGVLPCIDKATMAEASKENYLCQSPLSFTHNKSLNSSELNGSATLSGMRPLTQAYRVAASNNEVVQTSPILQKKSNPVSKAMEYVFGW